jgi:hypothetical protein
MRSDSSLVPYPDASIACKARSIHDVRDARGGYADGARELGLRHAELGEKFGEKVSGIGASPLLLMSSPLSGRP